MQLFMTFLVVSGVMVLILAWLGSGSFVSRRGMRREQDLLAVGWLLGEEEGGQDESWE